MRRMSMRIAAFSLVVLVGGGAATRAETKTLARCGAGFLEEVDGYRVLHVKGTLRDGLSARGPAPRRYPRERPLPLRGEGEGAQGRARPASSCSIPSGRSRGSRRGSGNSSPSDSSTRCAASPTARGSTSKTSSSPISSPSCSTVRASPSAGSATKDGTLYHGRILDYGCDWRLQDHAVLTVAEPRDKIPFVNVTYAGFVGSVTGMNAERISIGEMGGKRAWATGRACRWPSWSAWCWKKPTRSIAAIAIFRDNPRTCEYYFVIADGETGKAVGMEACWNVFGVIGMGEAIPRLPHAIKDAVVLSAGDRYKELVKRVEKGLGSFDAESARHLMDRPVAMKSNLHSVLFETTTTRFWVANASKDGKPAAEQPYHAFQLSELLKHQADPSSPLVARAASSARPRGERWRASRRSCPVSATPISSTQNRFARGTPGRAC